MNSTIARILAAMMAIGMLGAVACTSDDTDDPGTTDPPSTSTEPDPGDPGCLTTEAFPEDDDLTYPYPAGPGGYGFQTSMCWADTPFWGTMGEAIHNICLTDQDGNENVCLADYYDSPDYDLLIVDFSATWCGPCKQMAAFEYAIIPGMAERGWRVKWVTVLLDAGDQGSFTPPTQADAKWWQEIGWISPPRPEIFQEGPVLFDSTGEWGEKVFGDWWPVRPVGGFPAWMLVHPSNMVIWDTLVGLPFNPTSEPSRDQWLDNFAADLYIYAEQENACADDPCVILGPPDTDPT